MVQNTIEALIRHNQPLREQAADLCEQTRAQRSRVIEQRLVAQQKRRIFSKGPGWTLPVVPRLDRR